LKKESDLIKKKFPDAKETAAGVKFIINKVGKGDIPKDGAVFKVQYKGKFLLDGKSFVSTTVNGKPDDLPKPEVFEFTIGKTKINPGLDEMIADMKPGEKRTAVVLSKSAYGLNGYYGKQIEGKKRFVISPNTSLVYEIEIIK